MLSIKEMENFNRLYLGGYFKDQTVGEAFCEHFQKDDPEIREEKDNKKAVILIASRYIV